MAEKTYLADQETQDSIKELIEALSSAVAKEATLAATDAVVDAIKTVVDTVSTNVNTIKGYTDTLETNLAIVDSIVDTINTNTAANGTANSAGTLSQKLAYLISTLIGATNNTGGTASAGTVMAKLNKLLTAGTIPSVRKIQRGAVTFVDSNYHNITISGFTNVDKMIAFGMGGVPVFAQGVNVGGVYQSPAVVTISSNTQIQIKVYNTADNNHWGYYSVIEFY